MDARANGPRLAHRLRPGLSRFARPFRRAWSALWERLPHDRVLRPRWRRFARFVAGKLPKGLYPRSLLIIVTPIVILQAVIVFVFMERHWELVTWRLSQAVSRDIAALVEMYESYPQDAGAATLVRIAQEHLDLNVSFLPAEPLPPEGPRPFFSILDRTLSNEIAERIDRPFWIDTVGRSSLVEIRVALDDAVLRVFARRSQTYASNSHIFLVWMASTALVLIAVAILFLRNQIRPIQRLADAAEKFGMGQNVPDFRPRGAREVRRASQAFIEMRERIERHVEQRTAMLAGVSHDLRTVLTRFRLELAMLPDGPESEALRRDVDDMQNMLEGYLAFARGDGGEMTVDTDIFAMLVDLKVCGAPHGASVSLVCDEPMRAPVRPVAFRRMLDNLVTNAARYGDEVTIRARRAPRWLEIVIDDDGPGVPEAQREEVFRPFVRLDDARNQDLGGTGLGLAIARDVARGHGGDIALEDSPGGGLRVRLRVPV